MTPVTIKLPRPKIEPSLPQKTEVKRKKTSMRFHFPERVRSTPEEFKMANYSLVDKMYKGFCYTGVCKKFIGTEEVPFENPPCNAYMYFSRLVKYVNSPVNVTIIAPGSLNRFSMIKNTSENWAGFYCTALIVQEKEVPAIIRAIKAFHFNPRVTILLFFPPSYHRYFGTYPYNFLRNLCLRHTTTSHFLFLDTDMIPSRVAPPPPSPSGNLFDSIIHLPPEILDSPKAAVIIPPFFFPQRMSRVCGTLSACLNKFACSPLSTVGVWRWRRAPWRSSIAASSRVSATRRRGFSPRTSEFQRGVRRSGLRPACGWRTGRRGRGACSAGRTTCRSRTCW